MTAIVLWAALLASAPNPPVPKACPCSAACACGCNQGLPCSCGNPPQAPKKAAATDALPAAPRPGVENYGVDTSKLGQGAAYTRGGKEVTKAEAIAAIEAGVPDDKDLARITVIGPEPERSAVVSDLKSSPALAAHRPQYLVQGYDPSHWAVRDYGFVLTGSPTIYVQAPSGEVLHRQDAYFGAEAFAATLRKVDPAYDPAKDPDVNKPKSPLPFDLKDVPAWAWLAGGGVALYLLSNKEKK
jgi:hypothetical protein